MIKIINRLYFLVVICVISSCSSEQASQNKYKEDISKLKAELEQRKLQENSNNNDSVKYTVITCVPGSDKAEEKCPRIEM